MEYHDRIIPVKFTVKEYFDEKDRKGNIVKKENKLYAIEAIDYDIPGIKKGGMLGTLTIGDPCTTGAPIRPSKAFPARKNIGTLNSFPTNNISHLFDSINEYLKKPQKRVIPKIVFRTPRKIKA